MQVHLPDDLPDDLYAELKERGLLASELLQEAVRAELRRRALLDETDAYLTELIDEVGEPTPDELTRAEAIARQLVVVVESVTGRPGPDANTNRHLKTCDIVTEMPEQTARRAAVLRFRSKHGSAVDALVIAIAEPAGRSQGIPRISERSLPTPITFWSNDLNLGTEQPLTGLGNLSNRNADAFRRPRHSANGVVVPSPVSVGRCGASPSTSARTR